MKAIVIVCFVALCALDSHAQGQTSRVNVEVRAEQKPVVNAEITLEGHLYRTDAQGKVSIDATPGTVDLVVTAKGYIPQTISLAVAIGQTSTITVDLVRDEEQIMVTATRTDTRIEDQPTRVEVLDREEVEEKMLMTPGDITMMLNEMGGLRVQSTSPSLGAASVRIQGMRGRYTRFLSDGLPLFGQQVGGLGLLQIPPMDLARVEVIKGVSSALYGAGAMAGVVDLISRRPRKEAIKEFLINQTSRGGTDAVTFLAAPLKGNWSGSLLGGAHFQRLNDIDGDQWADMAGYKRGLVRPRLFWDGGEGKTLFVTGGFTYEDRNGGTVRNGVLPETGMPYHESLVSRNIDFGAVAQWVIGEKYLVSGRLATGRRMHEHTFGEVLEHDQHDTLFSEITVRRAIGKHTLVGGAAFEADKYDPNDVPRFRYRYYGPGVFIQDDFDLTPWLSFSASGRVDHHNIFGTFFSPRISALLRGKGLTSRMSWGQGFYAPTPLTEETEAAGLSRLTIPQPLKAEKGQSGSLDVTKTIGIASYTATFFSSRISNPSDVERSTYSLVNLLQPTRNVGVELLATFRPEHYSVTASYTYVRARKFENGQRLDVPLTPRQNVGLVGMWEAKEKGRVGMEIYYTGQQRLEGNPYRDESRPYFIFGFLAEKRFGKLKAFINAENLSDVRQTRWDTLLLPSRAVDGRWTVDAWSPLEGRVFNGGIRVSF